MKWSRYNFLFQSKKFGNLLYNSLSNTFASVDDEGYRELAHMAEVPDGADNCTYPALLAQLLVMKAVVEDTDERDSLNAVKLGRLLRNYDNSSLMLTIAPTQACNFNCTYCYELARPALHMTDDVEDSIVDFVTRRQPCKRMHVTWFGGEPLLQFNRIRSLTPRIAGLAGQFSASIVTNGYCLTRQIAGQLEGVHIKAVQVTIDGSEQTHNRRRPLAGGGATHATILANIEGLLTIWNGTLNIRVNIDLNNESEYVETARFLNSRFGADRVTVYPGFVHTAAGATCSDTCDFKREDEADFMLRLFRTYGDRSGTYYPQYSIRGCIARFRNGFVIGPDGALYKCWHDIGKTELAVGNVLYGTPWNSAVVSRYMVDFDPFASTECRECFFLPLCDGGCIHRRLNGQPDDSASDLCVQYKNRLAEYLEIHYEQTTVAT